MERQLDWKEFNSLFGSARLGSTRSRSDFYLPSILSFSFVHIKLSKGDIDRLAFRESQPPVPIIIRSSTFQYQTGRRDATRRDAPLHCVSAVSNLKVLHCYVQTNPYRACTRTGSFCKILRGQVFHRKMLCSPNFDGKKRVTVWRRRVVSFVFCRQHGDAVTSTWLRWNSLKRSRERGTFVRWKRASPGNSISNLCLFLPSRFFSTLWKSVSARSARVSVATHSGTVGGGPRCLPSFGKNVFYPRLTG